MTPDRFARLKTLLLQVMDLSPTNRQTFLDRECGDDPALRREIERMIEHDGDASGILRTGGGLPGASGPSWIPARSVANDSGPDRSPAPPIDPEARATPPLPSHELPDIEPGTVVGNYVIVQPITRGGIHKAFVVDHRIFSRRAVLYMPAWGETDRERFDRWLSIMAALNHPNIVTLFDCGEHEGTPYAVLRHIEGRLFGEELTDHGGIDPVTALRLFRTIASALAHCHERNIAHRNAKTKNIIVSRSGIPFLTGFNIAAAIEGDPRDMDRFFLTPHITPPEVWRYKSDMRSEWKPLASGFARADVWALGVGMYVAIAGGMEPLLPEYPSKGPWTEEDQRAVESRICSRQPLDLSRLKTLAPEPVVEMIARCLDKIPARRYRDCRQLEEAIDSVLEYMERTARQLPAVSPRPGTTMLLHCEPAMTHGSGRYVALRIGDYVGSGTYSCVYAADVVGTDHESADSRLALKILREDLVVDPDSVERFRREARFLSRVESPHVVGIRGFGRLGPTFFILMTLLEGSVLSRLIQREAPLSLHRAGWLCRQIASGLSAMHRKGLIHRDLKPDNVMVSDDDRVVIADFGLVHAADATRLTSTGMFCGTPAYASPEQLLGRELTPASDCYSLGVILYELLTGRRPHRASTIPALIRRVIDGPPASVERHRAEMPVEAVDVVMRSLARRAEDRYQSAEAFIEALSGPAFEEPAVPGME